MSEWKDLVDKINSAKLCNKYIEDSLQGLVYRYYNDGDKACDSRNDPYGYATKYFNALRDLINDSEIDDIMYKPRIKYETKLKILIDYVCDAYGKNSTKESKKSARKSIKESVEFYNDFGTGVYCATSSNGWTFCYCPLSWINKKGVEDLIGWSVMDDKAHYIDGDSWENKTDEEINDSIDNFEKLIKKYAKEDAKEIIKDFRSTLEKD